MRISACSLDVCSSDLTVAPCGAAVRGSERSTPYIAPVAIVTTITTDATAATASPRLSRQSSKGVMSQHHQLPSGRIPLTRLAGTKEAMVWRSGAFGDVNSSTRSSSMVPFEERLDCEQIESAEEQRTHHDAEPVEPEVHSAESDGDDQGGGASDGP